MLRQYGPPKGTGIGFDAMASLKCDEIHFTFKSSATGKDLCATMQALITGAQSAATTYDKCMQLETQQKGVAFLPFFNSLS